ncbi:MAG: threonine-phosphate decarboxylase CobD [bacterium]
MARDHGGNLDQAIRLYGGDPAAWIDLSTGINRVPYPVGTLPPEVWTALPTRSAMAALLEAARTAYRTTAPIVALSGAQGAIQLVPLLARGRARILAPTYNEHAAALRSAGWSVQDVTSLTDLAGADLAVVVNPNNPDGQHHSRADLLALVPKVGRLLVDESFADPVPEQSLAADAGRPGLIVLRSFGKFYGLAGLRLGFALGEQTDIDRLTVLAGPWPVAGAAIELGRRALRDADWTAETTQRLVADVARLDDMAMKVGWQLIGGTALFRTYATPDATSAQTQLARQQIWSRIFPSSLHWIRLGLPGTPQEWARLASACKVE